MNAHTQAQRQANVERALLMVDQLSAYADARLQHVHQQAELRHPDPADCLSVDQRKRKRSSPQLSGSARKQFDEHMLPGTPTQVQSALAVHLPEF